jgi:hypothetical protein
MVATAAELLRNAVLILQTLGVAIPGLSATASDLTSTTMRN